MRSVLLATVLGGFAIIPAGCSRPPAPATTPAGDSDPAAEPASGPPTSPPPGPPVGRPGPRGADAPADWAEGVTDRLVGRRWNRDAAAAVVAFHRDWLGAVRENDPAGFESTVARLGQIPNPGKLAGTLTRRPELAGLLAVVDDPISLAGVLTGKDGEILTGLFLVHLERPNARELAAVLSADGTRIAALMRSGLVGGEAVFLAARNGPGGKPAEDAYLAWVRKTLDDALAVREADPAELDETFLFILAEGADVRRRCADPSFRDHLTDRWQVIREMAAKLREQVRARQKIPNPDLLPGVTDLVALPGVWEFAARDDADRLFARRGVLAIDLVSGPRTPAKQRQRVAELLLGGDDRVAELLLDYLGDPRFLPFLAPNVPPDLLSDVAADLATAPNPVTRLEALGGELNAGVPRLRAAVAPRKGGLVEYVPLNSAYRVARKYADGDEVSDAEVLIAGADVLMTFAPVAKLGATVVKAGTKKGAADVAKKEVAKSAGEVAAKRLPGQAVRTTGEAATKAGLWAGVRESYRKMVQVLRSVATGNPKVVTLTTKVDVTGPVKFAFKSLGLKRDRFKRLTGLEARVFMRADAKVAIQLHWKIEGKKVRAWLLKFLIRQFGSYEVDGEKIPDAVRTTLPPPPPDDPVAARKAAGALFLAALADLLPEAEEPADTPEVRP